MDRLRLATIPAQTPLKDALAMLLPGTRAAVITGDGKPRLVTAGDILAACNRALDNKKDPVKIPVKTAVYAHRPVRVDSLEVEIAIGS